MRAVVVAFCTNLSLNLANQLITFRIHLSLRIEQRATLQVPLLSQRLDLFLCGELAVQCQSNGSSSLRLLVQALRFNNFSLWTKFWVVHPAVKVVSRCFEKECIALS